MGDFISDTEVREWFEPSLPTATLGTTAMATHIAYVEDYIKKVYELTSASDAKYPALLLVVSRIINLPSIASSYYTLRRETVRNYSYELDITGSPNRISVTLEDMAHRILNARSYVKDDKLKIYISNL